MVAAHLKSIPRNLIRPRIDGAWIGRSSVQCLIWFCLMIFTLVSGELNSGAIKLSM